MMKRPLSRMPHTGKRDLLAAASFANIRSNNNSNDCSNNSNKNKNNSIRNTDHIQNSN